MSHHRLADGISFCDLDGRIVLLDLGRDRYFGLGPTAEKSFRCLLGGTEQLSEPELRSLRAAGLIVPADRLEPILGACAAPPTASLVERRHTDMGIQVGLLPEIAARLWRARRGTGKGRLLRTVAALRTARAGAERSDVSVEILVPPYLAARRLLPFAPNCLRDSLALASFLASRRGSFQFVFGVRRDPFAAHCWLQEGSLVLNDSLDSVADFRPILVV
jgi:hypothetical protein